MIKHSQGQLAESTKKFLNHSIKEDWIDDQRAIEMRELVKQILRDADQKNFCHDNPTHWSCTETEDDDPDDLIKIEDPIIYEPKYYDDLDLGGTSEEEEGTGIDLLDTIIDWWGDSGLYVQTGPEGSGLLGGGITIPF